MTRTQIAAVVLSGGQGSRMGGVDKGLITYRTRPLVSHVLNALETQVEFIIISANRNLERYQSFGWPIVNDEENAKIYEGPLAGVTAAIEYIKTHTDTYSHVEALMLCPCDTPNVPNDLVARLLETMGDAEVCVAFDGHYQQNLHALIKRSAWDSLFTFYRAGERAIKDWYALIGAKQVLIKSNSDAFANLNQLENRES